jgi:ATP-dependent DNA helicase RecG
MRPEILFALFAPSSSLKGVGPRLAPLLDKLAGPRVRDVLFLVPQRIVRRTPAKVAEAAEDAAQIFELVIDNFIAPARSNQPWRVRAHDDTGFIHLTFFGGYGSSLEKQHPPGSRRAVSGKVERYGSTLQIAHPDYIVPIEKIGDIPALETVYPATAGLASRSVRKFALEAQARAQALPEWLDPAWMAREALPSWLDGLERLHSPLGEGDLSLQSPARRRLAYDELLAHQLALAMRRADRRRLPAAPIGAGDLASRLEAALPFKLTGAQIRTLSEIRGDLQSGERMARLVQGDVGSGKTVVALLAMADVIAAGRQAALMAPTEILARQHYETIRGPLEAQGVQTVLLTGRDKGTVRAAKLAALAGGAGGVAVGTHALFQDEVVFHDLALAVIDEQHRFGVNERRRLLAKGGDVHMLVMSATPIPRTLELTAFGDLDISRIDEKPPGRTPVATRAIPSPRLGEIVERLRAATAGGAQAFWVCPLVAESEDMDLAAAEARAASLRVALGAGVGLVHGQMKADAKDAVMTDFAEGRLSVLVATTVIEVGVDVPNASIMVIEQAERFGLAQLHQLRGRVGRGRRESSCILIYDPPLTETGQKRLDILRRTDDGFLIAEKDLELRGGGDPLGLRQSGLPAYRLADPAAHRDLIAVAADDARLVLARDPNLKSPRGQALTVLQALFDWPVGAAAERSD